MAARLFLIVFCTHLAFAQNALHPKQVCKTVAAPHDQTSFDKFMSAVTPTGSVVGVYAVVEESKPLALIAATAAAAASLYTYFQGQPTVEICTSPSTFDTMGQHVTFIGSAAALQPLTHPSPQTSRSLNSYNHAFRELMTPAQKNSLMDEFLSNATAAKPPANFDNFEKLRIELLTAKVRGRLTDTLGFPLSMGTVQITSVDQAGSWLRTLTRSDGTFELSATPGKYLLYTHVPGYLDFSRTFSKTNSLDSPLRIVLTKAVP